MAKLDVLKIIGRFFKKFRLAIVLSFSSLFFGFMIIGLTNLANIQNPWVYILIGFIGLVVMSWIGVGPLSMKK
jgi:membrane protease YdiL (CAAX protease family)